MDAQSAGWYPDPNDPKSELYWDGTRWHGQRKKSTYAGFGGNEQAGGAATPWPNVIPAKWVLAWRKLSDGAKVIVIVAVVLFLVLFFGWLSTSPWESQREKDCKVASQQSGLRGDALDDFVRRCVDAG